MRKSHHLLLLSLVALAMAVSLLASGVAAQRPTRPAVSATAAANDPFIGVWKLSADKSKYESGGAPRSFTRTYEDRGGGTIFMTTDVTIPQGSTRAYVVYRRDGKPYPEAALGAEAIRMIAVTAVDPHTERMYLIVDGKQSAAPSTTTISADGQTMTQVVSGTTSKGKAFTNTVVYDRQP